MRFGSVISILICLALLRIPGAAAATGTGTAESPVMGALAPVLQTRLSQWIAAWTAVSPDFDLRRFRMTLLKNVAEEWVADSTVLGEMHEDLRRKLYVTSPDGSKALYPYATISFVTRNERTTVGIGTDGAVMLIDLAGHRTMWLGQCDLGCGFHEAVWLANDRAVIAGYEVDLNDSNCPNSRACRAIPELLLYDFTRHVVMIFQGPAVPGGPQHEYAVQRIHDKLPNVAIY
ncbi:MAG TPA: hypothetical protein VGA58_07815 [bacterium]